MSIQASKSLDLWRLIHGIGIPNVGKQAAKDLEKQFQSLDKLSQASVTDLIQIDGIGSTMAESIRAWFSVPDNQNMIQKLKRSGLHLESNITAKIQTSESALNQKTVVITGKFESMTRDEASELIESAGGRVSSSVSAKTDFLLAGESGLEIIKSPRPRITILMNPPLKFIRILRRTHIRRFKSSTVFLIASDMVWAYNLNPSELLKY